MPLWHWTVVGQAVAQSSGGCTWLLHIPHQISDSGEGFKGSGHAGPRGGAAVQRWLLKAP